MKRLHYLQYILRGNRNSSLQHHLFFVISSFNLNINSWFTFMMTVCYICFKFYIFKSRRVTYCFTFSFKCACMAVQTMMCRFWSCKMTSINVCDRKCKIFTSCLGPELLVCCLAHRGSAAPGFSKLFDAQGSAPSNCLLNLFLFISVVIMIYLIH